MFVVLAAILTAVLPYVDAGTFRTLIIVFIAVSVKLQNLDLSQEIQRTRTMIQTLSDQQDTMPVSSTSSTPSKE